VDKKALKKASAQDFETLPQKRRTPPVSEKNPGTLAGVLFGANVEFKERLLG
jgi:hypothetical protein